MSIELRRISKTFGSFPALRDVSLRVPSGKLVAFLGPSGSGKTTLLRIIAGLELPDPGSGPILFHDEDVAGRDVRERQVGFVFQHYALFRHMTVFENIAFGLRVRPRHRRPSRAEIAERVGKLLRLIQLEAQADRRPSQLSGGQRQRVALARALAVEPQVLLLDEPFGALDAKVRQELRLWLRRLHEQIHLTSVFVTHDQEEALELADLVVVTNEGRIEQIGSPSEVYHQPATEFVMNFLGHVNFFHGRVDAGQVELGSLRLAPPGLEPAGTGPAHLFVRPHEFDIALAADGEPRFRAVVRWVNAAGPQVKVELMSEFGVPFRAELSQERFQALRLVPDQEVFVAPRTVKVFTRPERPPDPASPPAKPPG